MTVAAPQDENELQHLLATALASGRPFALRYPRGLGTGVPLDQVPAPMEIGRGERLSEGSDLTLLAYGGMVPVALEAAAALRARGLSVGVANARFAKPLDLALLREIRAASPRVMTLEEHLEMGGFGSSVLEAFHREGWDASGLRVHAIPDTFVEHGPAPEQRSRYKLDAEGVVERALELYPDLARAAGPAAPADRGLTLVEKLTWS
jgi:1-deoxy-D-xylulose-5-phosphate synthase